MAYGDFIIKKINMDDDSTREMLIDLLMRNDLTFDFSVEYTLGIFESERLIATGSVKDNTLRCIAVDKFFQGGRVLNLLISELVNIQYHNGKNDIFLFTKPASKRSFESLGFYVVEEIENQVLLMENRPDGLNNFLKNLRISKSKVGTISAIVMNCNPFTLGHRYLIEKASKESDHLHIFVLSSDESSFPYKVRLKLIKEGVSDIRNLTIHNGGNYIISNATFPSYFIKEKSDITSFHASLDTKIFGKHIAPCLGINRRYVGEEPYCVTTRKYNDTLKKILPQYGIEMKEIPRKKTVDGYISASRVRTAIAMGEIEKIKSLVPTSTYSFLLSSEGKKVITKIQTYSDKRH